MVRGTTCAIWVHPKPGCPSRQLSKMKSDWGISGRDGMNIMDTQTNRPLSPDPICFGPFHLSITERVLAKGSVPVRLGSRALDILIALVERPGEVVTKKDLFARVWPDLVVDEGNLRYHISALRKVLGERQSGTCYVTNVSGRGYCFVVPGSHAAPCLRELSNIGPRSYIPPHNTKISFI
jgi:DNA-binding winged helix-turn-helix (wHTH) protein